MEPGEPTHFNVLIAGTGLQESILAAALSKAGYSVLQLDKAPYYGTEHASLSLTELHDWATERQAIASTSTTQLPDDLARISQLFSLSLEPVLLRAQGPGLDLLVRSRVASYLQFGLLGGVGLFETASPTDQTTTSSEKGKGKVKRVPASKSDVFTDASLSLVEKRRLTKLLLFAAGQDPLEQDPTLQADPEISFVDYLKKGYNLSGSIADSLVYASALCTDGSDLALPALQRIRRIIHAVGRYGPSPFLVGHYGGAGDLVGGFSRICAVWGGGQILGRPILPLKLEPEVGPSVPPSQPPFSTPETQPPRPAAPAGSSSLTDSSRPLGIPVRLEDRPDAEPTVFTGDWVITSPHLFSTLFPSRPLPEQLSSSTPTSRKAYLIAILRPPVPFPPRSSADLGGDSQAAGEPPSEQDEPDSQLFVFPPEACHPSMSSVTALQTGKGTMSCPEGYHVLYLSGCMLDAANDSTGARACLEPYLDALLSLSETATSDDATDPAPVYTVAYWSPSSTLAPLSPVPSRFTTAASEQTLPLNLLITPTLPSASRTASLIETLDEVVPSVEELFWRIVGEEGRQEGVQFFAKEERAADDDE